MEDPAMILKSNDTPPVASRATGDHAAKMFSPGAVTSGYYGHVRSVCFCYTTIFGNIIHQMEVVSRIWYFTNGYLNHEFALCYLKNLLSLPFSVLRSHTYYLLTFIANFTFNN